METKLEGNSVITIESNDNTQFGTEVSLAWYELSYMVDKVQFLPTIAALNFCQRNKRVILHPQSGQLKVGCLMALIGKSGSGKSTLIESLTGRKTKGLKGDIFVNVNTDVSCKVDVKKIKIAFIPQSDALLSTLTVTETLLFASKLKNLSYTSEQHNKVIEVLLEELDLIKCRNSRVKRCSGGERKRLTVATELISKPTILIIDEPTSGLDSASALKCVQLLQKLTRSKSNPLAILISIHQPSAKLLNEFDSLYMLSFNGRCLYNGPVTDLLPFFDKFDISCPQYHNPADHALEVASGDYGCEIVYEMAEDQRNPNQEKEMKQTEKLKQYPISSVINAMIRHSKYSVVPHFVSLCFRTLKTTFRDPKLNYSRFALHLITAAVLVLLYTSDSGKHSGCIDTSMLRSINKYFDIQKLVFQNLGLIFFTLLFTLFASSMPVVLSFPMEMTVFLRERTNGWYSCFAYYLAKTVADVPFLVFFTTIYSLIIYYLTGQINESWRFAVFLLVSILISFLGQSIGLIVGAFFMNNVITAAFMAPLSMLPFTLFSGFLIRLPDIPSYLKFIAEISPMRYAFGSLVVTIYGFNRCEEMSKEHKEMEPTMDKNMTLSEHGLFNYSFQNCTLFGFNLHNYSENQSFALQKFYVKDDDLLPHILWLVLISIVMRVATYFVLLFKANHRN